MLLQEVLPYTAVTIGKELTQTDNFIEGICLMSHKKRMNSCSIS